MRLLLVTIAAVAMTANAASAAPKPATKPAPKPAAAMPATPATPLERLLAIARSDAKRLDADQFADPTPVPEDLVGQTFHVILPVNDILNSTNATYQDGKLRMYLKLDARPADTRQPISQWRHDKMIELKGAIQNRGSYVGSNAFGATRTVTVADSYSSAIVAVSYPEPGLLPGIEAYATERTERDAYPLVLDVPGSVAKSMIETTRVVVEGKIAPLSNGKQMGCDTTYHAPTLDAPSTGRDRTCWVAAHIARVAFVNGATGEVLKEWKDSTPEGLSRDASVTVPPGLIERYYPDRAQRMEASGSADLKCAMSSAGALSACAVVSESVQGMGFGDAALNIARLVKGEPKMVNGARVDSVSTFTISFAPQKAGG